MGTELKKIQFFKNKIHSRLEELRPLMPDIKYRLYITMIDDCDSYEEIREMAELDLQFGMIKYVMELEDKLKVNNTNLEELEAVTNKNARASKLVVITPKPKNQLSNKEKLEDIDISTLGEDMEDEDILASAANILLMRMRTAPPEELYRDELENYEEDTSEEDIDSLDDDELYQDTDEEFEDIDEEDELEFEDGTFEELEDKKIDIRDIEKSDIIDKEDNDILDFGDTTEEDSEDGFDIDDLDEIDDDSLFVDSDSEDDLESDIDSLDDSELFMDDDEDNDDDDEFDNLDESELFGDNDDEEDDIDDIDSLGDDLFEDTDELDIDSLGDDLFEDTDELFDDSNDIDDDEEDEIDDDSIDDLDGSELFDDSDSEEDDIDSIDEDEFDIDISEFEPEEPEDDLDDFFNDLNRTTSNKNSSKENAPVQTKRELTPQKVFINNTKRGEQTQQMFNLLGNIFSGAAKLTSSTSKNVAKAAQKGVNKINSSSYFNLDNNRR